MQKIWVSILVLMAACCNAQSYFLVVGTYTHNSTSKGIYVYDFATRNGGATLVSTIQATNPSYLAISENGTHIYSVQESDTGKIAAFSFDKKTGSAALINEEKNGGSDPCYVMLDKTGKWLFAGNYSSGDLTVHAIQKNGAIGPVHQHIRHTGSGPDTTRQKEPHVHCTYIAPDNQQLYVADLGIDKIIIYPFDAATGRLSESHNSFVAASPGGGPRHIALTKQGDRLYAIEEMSGSIVVWQRNTKGALTKIQNINALPEAYRKPAAGADIHLSPDNKFLYASQRSNHTLQIFKVLDDGTLLHIANSPTQGQTPRNFSIDPSGQFLLVAHQNSNSIVVFKRNTTTGLLTDTGTRINVAKPVCLQWIKK